MIFLFCIAPQNRCRLRNIEQYLQSPPPCSNAQDQGILCRGDRPASQHKTPFKTDDAYADVYGLNGQMKAVYLKSYNFLFFFKSIK